MSLRPKRVVCESCGRDQSRRNIARHRRTCKGPKQLACAHCGAAFKYPARLRRHLKTCARARSHESELLAAEHRLNATRTELSTLLAKLEEQGALLARTRAKLEQKDGLLNDARSQLDHNTSWTRAVLEEKDRQLAAANAQLAMLARPEASATINLAIHMTPWCLDPAAEGYADCLREDVAYAKQEMAPVALQPPPPNPDALDYFDRRELVRTVNRCKVNSAYKSLMRRVIVREAGENPRYIVPDLARRKGMFVMPDGSCRFDAGMALLQRHQQLVLDGLYDDAHMFQNKEDVRKMLGALASEGYSAAKCLRKKARTPPT